MVIQGRWIKWLAGAMLVVNSTGAFYGGLSLIRYPDGRGLQLDLALLQHSPFSNYLVPGMLLILFNGVLSALVLWMLLTRRPAAAQGIMLQGLILGTWILVQVMMIRVVFILHFIFLLIAIVLLLLGFLLKRSIE